MTTIETLQEAQARGMAARPRVGGFPYYAEALRQAGVLTCEFDVATRSGLYVLADGAVLQPGAPLHEAPVEFPPFNRDGLIAALRADQAGDSTFPEFVAASFAAGVVGYRVDFEARTCTYRGAAGETYEELYPHVELTEG